MRFPATFFSLFIMAATAVAQPAEPPQPVEAAGASAREVALDNLLSERDSDKELESVIASARKAGISNQAILEARFLFHVDRREDDAVAAMLPAFLKQREEFMLGDSAIFSVKEDWLAVVEYVQAIASLKKGDKDGFKSHITEAFWLSPRQASAFAPHIDRMRLEEAMRAVRIDFEIKLAALGGGDEVALKSLMAGKKAMVLHFWSPASRECEASMPDYVATARALGEKGVAMVSVLPEDAPKILTDARAMIQPLGEKPSGAWLIDRKENPLARDLRVQTLPSFILVSNEGRILFNGDPSDDGLWDALAKIDPKIVRPASPGEAE
ncbi:MAG: redoxin family protein [Verrucomicrobiota bacterium]